MPLPRPDGETHEEYIDRCMSSASMKREFPDHKQRYAVCQGMWEDRGKEALDDLLDACRKVTRGD